MPEDCLITNLVVSNDTDLVNIASALDSESGNEGPLRLTNKDENADLRPN